MGYLSVRPPLASLTNLETLYLDNNQITDISPLASLTNLKFLVLNGNPMKKGSIEKLKNALPWTHVR